MTLPSPSYQGTQEGEVTDAELTAIYKRANGEDTGKAKPLTTANIFRAMRACIALGRTQQPSDGGKA